MALKEVETYFYHFGGPQVDRLLFQADDIRKTAHTN